jgi:hypothetical protein
MENKNVRPTEIEKKSVAELNTTTANHASSTRDIVPTAKNRLVQCASSVSIYKKKSVANNYGIAKSFSITKWTKMSQAKMYRLFSSMNEWNYGSLPFIIDFITATVLDFWCRIVPQILPSSEKRIHCYPPHYPLKV